MATIQIRASLPFLSLGEDTARLNPLQSTSPIFIIDKDYEFSIDPELITLVESDPFHGYETETVMARLPKLNDIATLFA